MRQLIICILLTSLGFVFKGLAQEFKAGAAIRVITPDPLLPVSGGVGTPSPTTVKKGDLYARAVVFEKGDTRVAIVNIDNLGWPAALGDQSRALITGIPAENVLIGVTHTHSAPDAYAFPDERGNTGADLEYLDWCVKQVAEAVNEAAENLKSASLKIAVGKAEGKIAFNYYAPQLYDPRCGVIQAIGTTGEDEGKAIATLVNYAIHPEVLGANQGILSPDMCGPLYEQIEDKAGGIAIFMNSALGGMVTADNRRDDGNSENTWEECIRIGNQLADEALRIISEAELQVNPGLYCASQEIIFPVDSEMMRYILQNSPLSLNTNQTNTVSTRLNLVNIGTAQILTIPGEALPNIGYYLKRNVPTQHSFLFGLTNDAFGYILTKEDFNSFERYDYISRTSLGEMTGEIYIEEALNLIGQSPEPTEQ
ncbi:MAG: hypothetical protein AAF992_25480 [Bacteroidota bacterium]